MNREMLERLIIDRASGELSPDVAALLEDYLAGDAAMADEAEHIEETLRLAKLAMSAPCLADLPALRPGPLLTVVPGGTPMARLLPHWAYGMAACFAGGLLLGFLAMHGGNALPPAGPASQVQISTPAPPPVDAGFWSLARLRRPSPGVAASSDYQVIWTSPVKQPEIKSRL